MKKVLLIPGTTEQNPLACGTRSTLRRHLLPISKQSPPAASLFFVLPCNFFFCFSFFSTNFVRYFFCGPNQLRIPKCDCDCEWQRAQCEESAPLLSYPILSCPVLPLVLPSLMTADRPFAIQINLWLTNV